MSLTQTLTLHDKFTKQAAEIRQALGFTSECLVNLKVLYGLPDHPKLLQEFLTQEYDVFEPGRDLLALVDKFTLRMNSTKTLTGLVRVYDEWSLFAERALKTMDNTEWKFAKPAVIGFNTASRADMIPIIGKIPFPAIRQFMTTWIEGIEGTPKRLELDPKMMETGKGTKGNNVGSAPASFVVH